ncbi:uncharacterized protein LOC142986322 [Anticarsia gemmatalis]|uniref:uncharacterized protein LOC142986322 n=1 Tax=Anticarsia gemmatalis TaxID=129554 RepID=UPI003F75D6B7
MYDQDTGMLIAVRRPARPISFEERNEQTTNGAVSRPRYEKEGSPQPYRKRHGETIFKRPYSSSSKKTYYRDTSTCTSLDVKEHQNKVINPYTGELIGVRRPVPTCDLDQIIQKVAVVRPYRSSKPVAYHKRGRTVRIRYGDSIIQPVVAHRNPDNPMPVPYYNRIQESEEVQRSRILNRERPPNTIKIRYGDNLNLLRNPSPPIDFRFYRP